MSNDRSKLAILRDDVEAYREQIIKPRLADIESEVEDALQRIEDLEAENEQLQTRVEQLDHQVENLIGVDDPDLSTHEKRVRDVRAAMIRRAEAKAEKHSDVSKGKISLYYKEVQNLLADHGHGDIYDTQVRRVMDEIENVDGFTYGKKTSPESNRKVTALRLNLEALPTYAGTNDVFSSSVGEGGEQARKNATQNK